MRDIKIKARKHRRVKILKGGYVTIPSALRRSLDMNPGDEVELVVTEDGSSYVIPTKNRPKAYEKLHELAAKVVGDRDSATLSLNESQFGLDGAIPVEHEDSEGC